MEYLASLFVGRPIPILAIAAVFLAAYIVLRRTRLGSDSHPWPLLVAAAAWTVYAAWEWLILIRTPEANIRVDLIVIWPLLLIVSICFPVRVFRQVARGAAVEPGKKGDS